MRLELVRYAVLLVPLTALAAAMVGRSRTRRELGGLLLAGLAAALGLAVLHELATIAGWWRYAEVDGNLRGLPVDLWLGWAILWGPLPVALRDRVGLPTAILAAAWLDVVAMPHLAPVVVLDDGWLIGELVGLAAVLVPATLVGSWTADRRHLGARVTLQALVAGGLVLWLLPTVAFTFGNGGWHHLTALPFAAQAAVAQLALVLGLPAVAAANELAVRGGGSPYPWDPPVRLVTSGPYAYTAAPMQASATALLVLLAVVTRSWSVAAAATGALAFSATVALPHEDEHLAARFGDDHRRYRSAVRTWRPRWRPVVAEPAELWLARRCGSCRELRTTLEIAGPIGLTLRDAETYPGSVLVRARYRAADGSEDDGVAAIGRALEHLHLGAAWVGWLVRLPGMRRGSQLVADVVTSTSPPSPSPAPPGGARP